MQKLYNQIKSLGNYKPSKRVNALFTKLVDVVLSKKYINLSKVQINSLQKICSMAEYELEKYWAQKIIKSSKPDATLKDFVYLENYQKLTRLEWFSLKSCSFHKRHSILFIGGGPLPMTAIILASAYKQKVTILERERVAFQIASKLIQKLKLNKKIQVVNSDALDFNLYYKHNVIFLAALVSQKNKVLSKIKLKIKKNTHILARSSWGTRKILYKPLSKSSFNIFKPIIEIKPMNDIVNSFIIFKNN